MSKSTHTQQNLNVNDISRSSLKVEMGISVSMQLFNDMLDSSGWSGGGGANHTEIQDLWV